MSNSATTSNSAICRFVLNGKVLTGTMRRKMESIPYYLVDVDGKRYIVEEGEMLREEDSSTKQNEQKAKKRGRPPKKKQLGN